MFRNEPPSPALSLTLLIPRLVPTLGGIRAITGLLGRSDFLRFLSALRMQHRRHFLQILTCMKFSFDLGDVGQSLAGSQKGLFDFMEVLDLMFNQAGNEAPVVV